VSLRVAGLGLVIAGCATSAAPTDARTSAPKAAVRYLALGDSFTIGTGTTPDRSFPARLADRWPCRVELRNLGVNGYTTEDLIDRELPELEGFAPTFVTLAIGANDLVQGSSAQQYRVQVHRILATIALGAPRARVVVLPQPDWALSPAAAAFADPARLRVQIFERNAVLREETAAAGGLFVDLSALMESQARAGMIAADQLHPSAPAYDGWAAELERALPSPCSPGAGP
jgi:acyl-CoA thioesterase-1